MPARAKAGLPDRCVACPQSTIGFCGALFNACLHNSSLRKINPRFSTVRAGQRIPYQSQSSGDILILCTGWAFRYCQLADDGRQILKFLLPGDLFSPATIFSEHQSFFVGALTDVQVGRMEASEIRKKCLSDEAVMLAVFNTMMDDGQDAYQLLATLGRRPADARVAYLLLNLMRRIASRSVIPDHRYPLPLRQQHIADAVGLTPVHVNRVLAQFRDQKILTLAGGTLEITDLAELERIGSLA